MPGSEGRDSGKDKQGGAQSPSVGLGLGINMDPSGGSDDTREHEREGSSGGVDEACWIYEHLRFVSPLIWWLCLKTCLSDGLHKTLRILS